MSTPAQTILAQLTEIFVTELEEHVESLNQDLLALEQTLDAAQHTPLIANIFRSAHSLKGAARAVEQHELADTMHVLEDLLAKVRSGAHPIDEAFFSLMFAVPDLLSKCATTLRTEGNVDVEACQALRKQLDQLDQPAEQVLPQPATTKLSPPSPQSVSQPAPLQTSSHEPTHAATSVRVPARKLDSLVAQSNELVVAEAKIDSLRSELAGLLEYVKKWQVHRDDREHFFHIERQLERLYTSITGYGRAVDRAAKQLDHGIRGLRMQAFSQACAGLERIVRDIAKATGKLIQLQIEGGDVELDRAVLERLKSPLLHLVRNSCDHGIEFPTQRQKAGKDPCGTVRICAALRGGQVEIMVEDDGQGIDIESIRQSAARKGIPVPDDPQQISSLIFAPGFSTKTSVSDISGRGVGMDSVKSELESLHGMVGVESNPGQGCRFRLMVPLTLSKIRALLVRSASQVLALPSSGVMRLLRIPPQQTEIIAGRSMLALDGAYLPIAGLDETLGLNALPSHHAADEKRPVAIVGQPHQAVAIFLDQLLEEREFVVKSLGPRLSKIPAISGATLLAGGDVALILNISELVRSIRHTQLGVAANHAPAPHVPATTQKILIVDDSVTTRILHRSFFENQGFDVLVATDGADAWRILQEQSIDLVISDIEMPRMDGFMLTQHIRTSTRHANLPVILVTSLERPEDKARGLEAGANAYIVKQTFEQQKLLETVRQVL